MTDDPMTTDLNTAQRRRLTALLDTLVPADETGRMPSAAELEFLPYLAAQAGDFLVTLPAILDRFDDAFAAAPLPDRVAIVDVLARAEPKLFDGLLMRVYDCYYQDNRVRRLIGAEPGPPFPRGNVIPAGDLSGLDAVAKRSRGYRR